jgi:hypothetical protein
MNQIEKLLAELATSRNQYLSVVNTLTEQQAQWKSTPEVWSVLENTEHLFWAEHGAIVGMWKSLLSIREGKMARRTESVHQNMPIEQIIELTWQAKEIVPAVAAPRMGGPIAFWAASLARLQDLTTLFANELTDSDLRTLAHPHPISGDMDFQQRLEFLRFHIDRHRAQVEGIIAQAKSSTPSV